MIPPNEIKVINHRNATFKATVSYRPNGRTGALEFYYNVAKASFQYRLQIPGVLISMVTVDITERELREFVNTGKPVRIYPQ